MTDESRTCLLGHDFVPVRLVGMEGGRGERWTSSSFRSARDAARFIFQLLNYCRGVFID